MNKRFKINNQILVGFIFLLIGVGFVLIEWSSVWKEILGWYSLGIATVLLICDKVKFNDKS